jgi:hypothetical protein
MSQPSGTQAPVVLSYLDLRKAVGIIGVALPFVLAIGKVISQGPGFQDSISSYYYTDMRNIFVGSLCAIGLFLMSCRGYDWRDRLAGTLACIFAVGVAFFPTTPSPDAPARQKCIGMAHLTFAALLFLTLAFFCIKLFTETDQETPTRQKLQRNIVYRICGYAILGCILFIAIFKLFLLNLLPQTLLVPPVFLFESLAILAFGVAWLIKGETLLKDQQQT